MRPWLSVIMPTYNGERFLDAALASVAAQRADDVEIIVVDDESTDGTLAALRRWSRRLPITIIARSHLGNWVSSTVIGMAAARGEYISWLHQDDLWSTGRLAALRAKAAKYPEAALIVHPCWYSNERGRRIGYWRCPVRRTDRLLDYRDVGPSLLVQCWVATCGTLFRADAADRVGPPDSSLPYHADWDYWLRLALLGRTLYHSTPLSSFRIHAGSQTITRAGEADSRRVEARLILEKHLPHLAAFGDDVQTVHELASFSADINHALNSLVAGNGFDVFLMIQRALALDPFRWGRLLRESRLLERCVSRLQTSAGLRPAILAGIVKVARGIVASPRASESPLQSLPMDLALRSYPVSPME